MNNENQCFCELAPLYALDLLDEAERLWVEQHVKENPELVAELTEYATATTAIPYGVTFVPMADNLKDRLFASLDLDLDSPSSLESPTVITDDAENNITSSIADFLPSLFAIRQEDMEWQPHPTPGVEVVILRTNEAQREIVGLLRAAPGVRYPLHRHAFGEDIFMLEGDLIVGDEVYGAFDYIRSEPGSIHAPHTIGGCMFFFRTSIDDEYGDLVAV